MNVVDDQQLARAARIGEVSAFAELVGRHYPLLLASCRRMLGDPELAADAAQEATLRAMLGLEQLRDGGRFGSWLVGIGLNVCRGLLIQQHRRRLFEVRGDEPAAADPPSASPDLAAQVDAEELARRVRKAIAALPVGQRQAVTLFYLGGLTHAEAAAELGTRPTAVKTRLHNARQALRDSLHDTYQEFIDMTEQTPQLISMRVAQVRRAPSPSSGLERHIVFLEDERGRRLPIWIGPAEATAMALVLEQVDLPRPGVYQFAASLLTGAGSRLREVRVCALNDSIFYAEAILEDDTRVDARPSDALTLALVSGAPIYVDATVLRQAELTATTRQALIDEAEAATEDSRVIVEEVLAARTAISEALREPGR